MSKMHLKVTLDILCESDLTDLSEIMDNIEINAVGDGSDVEVYDTTIGDYELE